MKQKILLLVWFYSLMMPAAMAQFRLSAEIRPRFEYRHGYKTLPADTSAAAWVTGQRTRLVFDYQSEKISSSISVQDARIWGEIPARTDAPSVSVYEAWLEPEIIHNLWIRAGRQSLSYDNEKLLGQSNWSNTGLSHDAALIRFEPENLKVHFGAAYNNDSNKIFESEYRADFYKSLVFLWLSKNFRNVLTVSLMGLADGYREKGSATRIYHRYTYGFYLTSAKDSGLVTCRASFYMQNGRTGAGKKINAFNAEAYILVKPVNNLSLIAALDYYSGNDLLDTLDQAENAFTSLYNTPHSILGYMDYFTALPRHAKGAGLIDLYIRAEKALPKKLSLEATLHYFRLSNALPDPAYAGLRAAKQYLGTEFDILVKWQIMKDLNLTVGYCTMFGSPTLELLKGGNHEKYADWAFAMLTFKPVLFSR